MTINVVSGGSGASLTVNGEGGDDVFKIDASNNSVGTISINGGDGTDTIRITGTAANKTISVSISGIERINLETVGPQSTTLELTVTNGFNDAITITDVATPASTQTIRLNVDAGGSVDGSNLAFLGWTSGTDKLMYVSNIGNETFTLGAKNAGVNITETVVFAATASNNGIDTINNFTTGTGGDILDFSAFTTAAGNFITTLYTSNPGVPTSLANNSAVRLVDIPGGQDITTEAGLLAALNVGGEYSNINGTASGNQIIFLTASSATATTFYVFYAVVGTPATEFASVTLVGTVNASGDLSSLVAANFDLT
jgi:hypothetical protein